MSIFSYSALDIKFKCLSLKLIFQGKKTHTHYQLSGHILGFDLSLPYALEIFIYGLQ